jgi:putative membrane protein
MTDGPRRFPAWVYRDGDEPDARFSLANERTFLAWVRTALALLAGGVALGALHLPPHGGLRIAASVLLLALGLLASVQAWIGWARTERALRLGRALPGPITGLIITVGVCVTAVLVLIGSLA